MQRLRGKFRSLITHAVFSSIILICLDEIWLSIVRTCFCISIPVPDEQYAKQKQEELKQEASEITKAFNDRFTDYAIKIDPTWRYIPLTIHISSLTDGLRFTASMEPGPRREPKERCRATSEMATIHNCKNVTCSQMDPSSLWNSQNLNCLELTLPRAFFSFNDNLTDCQRIQETEQMFLGTDSVAIRQNCVTSWHFCVSFYLSSGPLQLFTMSDNYDVTRAIHQQAVVLREELQKLQDEIQREWNQEVPKNTEDKVYLGTYKG